MVTYLASTQRMPYRHPCGSAYKHEPVFASSEISCLSGDDSNSSESKVHFSHFYWDFYFVAQ